MIEKNTSNEEQRISLHERLWLAYFNQYLYENGMISESQRNKIKNMIDCRRLSVHSCDKLLKNNYTKE